MKKVIILTALFVCANMFNANAQNIQGNAVASKSLYSVENGTITKGTSIVNASLDFLADDLEFPFISASYEYIVSQFNESFSLGVGGLFGYAVNSKNYSYYKSSYNMFGLYGLVNIHYNPVALQKIDFYGGLQIGLVKSVIKGSYRGEYAKYADGLDYSNSSSDINPFFGARYFFNISLAAGITINSWGVFNVGVTYLF